MKRPPKPPPDDDGPSWFPEPEASLILRLLDGITEDVPSDDYSRIRRLTASEEREGCKALAELLRTRKRRRGPRKPDMSITKREALFNEVCHRLADMFDPDNTDKRKIEFTNQWRQLPQRGPQLKIFLRMKSLVNDGLTVSEAVAKVAKKHRRSDRWAWAIWTLFRPEHTEQ